MSRDENFLNFKKSFLLELLFIYYDCLSLFSMHTPFISSLQHPIVKHLYKLKNDRDYRREFGYLVMTGDRVIHELNKYFKIKTLLIKKGTESQYQNLAASSIYSVTEEILKKIAGTIAPQNVLAEIKMPSLHSQIKYEPLLILDGVSDPGNTGTLLRSALAFDFKQVAFMPHSCDPYNEKALRSARGATFFLDLIEMNQDKIIDQLKELNLPLYRADINGQYLDQLALSTQPCALILGHESHGVSNTFCKNSKTMTIRMNTLVDSLNVGVAGSVLMYEISQAMRQ